MSDHVLLASAVHGGLATEALLPLLNWRHAQAAGARRCGWRAAACSLSRQRCEPLLECSISNTDTVCLPTPAGRGTAFLRAYTAAAGALALLVSAECYFTVSAGGRRWCRLFCRHMQAACMLAGGRCDAHQRLHPAPPSLPLQARYFHPPGEILLAAAIGLALFQAPLLAYAALKFQEHHLLHTPEAAAAAADAAGGVADGRPHES